MVAIKVICALNGWLATLAVFIASSAESVGLDAIKGVGHRLDAIKGVGHRLTSK
jgi:hypothetical protein